MRDNIRTKVLRTDDGCLLWTGRLLQSGYGTVNINFKTYGVHRIAYYLVYGNFTGMVLHSCDHPNCVEPTHLHLGNHAMNTQEAVARGRHWAPTGTQHHLTHLTEDDVREIRRLRGDVLQKELASRFRISQKSVSYIQNMLNWAHVQ